MPTSLPPRPIDATLSVTKAARLLGVHPNTIRAWSDAGRLRYYRINPRGDRRYRLNDLQRFLAAAENGGADGIAPLAAHLPHGAAHRRGIALGGGVAARRIPHLGQPGDAASRSAEVDLPDADRSVALGLLADLSALAAAASEPGQDLDGLLAAATQAIRDAGPYHVVAVWELRDEEFIPRATAGPAGTRLVELPRGFGLLGRVIDEALGAEATEPHGSHPDDASLGLVPRGGEELGIAIRDDDGQPWGVLHVVAAAPFEPDDRNLAEAAARCTWSIVRARRCADDVAHQLHRLEALGRVASDIGSRLDLDQILAGLVDHAMVLFEADRGAVFLRRPNGSTFAEVARNLSPGYLASVKSFPTPSLPASAVSARRPLFAVGYRDDPRGVGVRAAIVQEGFDTICTAPLFDGTELLGLLNVYHDRPHRWTDHELDTMAALAAQAAVAIKTAQNYSQMATWAAQLQSIQQLGARLNRLTNVQDIGLAIATELRQLIDYHNVRVYRLYGDELVPVAMQGQVGEYVDETPEQLRVKLGQGITGWVAEHQLAQNLPNAAHDPRANTIPGTEEDLDESMLLAPMIFEDQVLGVLVLSKLGLDQFSDDDLRLLVIYASFAAQAMANADGTERLREQSTALARQLRSQRELLQITESILTTLDPTAILEQISDRLGILVGYDNIAIEIADPVTGLLRPLTARGVHAAQFLEPWQPGETGIATWVVEHNEPQLIPDERTDPRVNHFGDPSTVDGCLIVVPLRSREGATGVLTLERLGMGNTYSEEEFELVKLFAAQVSIALQNAEIHRAVEIRARTDDLTRLLNHGTFRERLAANVARGDRFSLVMIDLDDFKSVNDALGHQAGDRLLAEIGRAIVAAGRETDHVFRYGGDEFAVILPGAGPEDALVVADRIRSAIETVSAPGSSWNDDGIAASSSMGVATFPVDGATADLVLLAADRACFVSKRRGRGRISTADDGLALAAEFSLQKPTPVDPPTPVDEPPAMDAPIPLDPPTAA